MKCPHCEGQIITNMNDLDAEKEKAFTEGVKAAESKLATLALAEKFNAQEAESPLRSACHNVIYRSIIACRNAVAALCR